ncbi:MAG: flavodoxin-dependent (E)-4-hydroxy-3-methylbut-2-enyl-diphosphate synthase [Candidatus Omnitrophota bacterium]|jgi:(E)-4-hydroxy-3-methylbut-2-enyl-diphosphate synthase
MIKRKKTRVINVGGVRIGGANPIAIQSMTNHPTSDVVKTVAQIKALTNAGCEIVRVAVKSESDACAIKQIKRRIGIPIVADIHFDHRLALLSIKNGADKIRLNPGNIRGRDEIVSVIKAAKSRGVPIRIGVNSGSLEGRRLAGLSQGLVRSAVGYVKLFEELRFRDIILSLKGSDVVSTIEAYKKVSGICDYPLHLGITASGPYDTGIVKSSIGIGALLAEGIGDTIRVSLTADPVDEVTVGRTILSSLNIRRFGPEILSCPTCGRCQVDLIAIVNGLQKKLSSMRDKNRFKTTTIAVMGCEVNGPGEAKEADIGVAFGKNSGMLFKKGKIIRKIASKNAIMEILKNL